MFFMSASMASSFVEAAASMTEKIKKMGPNPLR
jgi:coenzyme F420-reducing hydrogenase delta subunit